MGIGGQGQDDLKPWRLSPRARGAVGVLPILATLLALAQPGWSQSGATDSAGKATAAVDGVAAKACAEDEVLLRGAFGMARFSVEIADDAGERAQGLMNRKSMARGAGMLFVYPRAGSVSFWMRNTLIPLDMIFLNPAGVVTRVHSNATPLDETPIPGGDGVLAVLEINGGLAEAYGIEPGVEMKHPAFGAEAAWPCAGPSH